MANWTNEPQPFGANRAPLLAGLSSVDGETPVPVAVDPTTGAILTEASSSGGSKVNLVEVGGTSVTLGQNTEAASIPVTIASDQTAIPANINDVYLAIKELLSAVVRPPWLDSTTGALRANLVGTASVGQMTPYTNMGGIWTSVSATSVGSVNTADKYSVVDSMLNPINKQAWGVTVRERIN